jgi:hypothetical protein
MAVFFPFRGVVIPARVLDGSPADDALRARLQSGEFKPAPEPGLFIYSAAYSAGDGRIKTAFFIGALAPVSSALKKGPHTANRIFFVYDDLTFEDEIIAGVVLNEPIFNLEKDSVTHRLWAASGEAAAGITSALKETGFCHDIEGKTKPNNLAPVWIGNLGKDGWAFAPEGAFVEDADVDAVLKTAGRNFKVREYLFPKKTAKPPALEDFLEDLRFEAVVSGVMGFAPAGKKAYYLFMHDEPDVNMQKAVAAATGLKAEFTRMLPGPAIEEAERRGTSLFLTHPAMKREVVVLAQSGVTRISSFPLCFNPLHGMLWHNSNEGNSGM